MKQFKKILLAGIAIGFGLASSTTIARPGCQTMCDMCNATGSFCHVVRGDGDCGYGIPYGC
ncbi:MAG: hypothetical protein HRT35_25895 [Algicola sp.]|nr:hypothetical protein [Algicola sp.]